MLVLRSHAEQVADYLRQELERGRWRGSMPGVLRLEKDLGVNRNTVEAALKVLEQQGVLLGSGAGKSRTITSSIGRTRRQLRIAILLFEPADSGNPYVTELSSKLRDRGHIVFIARKSLCELGMNVRRVAKLVASEQADGWVILSGPRAVLEWFVHERIPACALFGGRAEVDIAAAGPDKLEALKRGVDRLVHLGHRKIVMISRRVTDPCSFMETFLASLKRHGISTGPYNLPVWEPDASSLMRCLHELFRVSPPTAILADEAEFYMAIMQFCLGRGLRVPSDLSLMCNDGCPYFSFLDPVPARIEWQFAPVIRHVVRWADMLAKGTLIRDQLRGPAKFIDGATIGPVASTQTKGR